jgi:hypothetical protein
MIERAIVFGLLALISLTACGPADPGSSLGAGVSEPAPGRVSETPAPRLSYEVGIATAAANRNRALRECDLRPQPERGACVEVALANWEVERAAMEGLRGESE